MNSVIVRPVITEKSMRDAQNGKFTFVVANSADKKEIKNAVEEVFKVHVEGVSTITVKGKSIRVGKKRTVKNLTPYKKAMVEVKQGEKIDLFDLGEQK